MLDFVHDFAPECVTGLHYNEGLSGITGRELYVDWFLGIHLCIENNHNYIIENYKTLLIKQGTFIK